MRGILRELNCAIAPEDGLVSAGSITGLSRFANCETVRKSAHDFFPNPYAKTIKNDGFDDMIVAVSDRPWAIGFWKLETKTLHRRRTLHRASVVIRRSYRNPITLGNFDNFD